MLIDVAKEDLEAVLMLLIKRRYDRGESVASISLSLGKCRIFAASYLKKQGVEIKRKGRYKHRPEISGATDLVKGQLL